MMMTELMLGRTAADESFAGVVCEMSTQGSRATSEEPLATYAHCERLAAMPMPELLYYVLIGEGEVADEIA